MTLKITIRTKVIISGRMPMFSNRLSWCNRLSAEAVASSFWTSEAINTKMPIKANEPAMAVVVKIEIVEVVTVDIINLSPRYKCPHCSYIDYIRLILDCK